MSRGNLKEEGAGGALLHPNGKIEFNFASELGFVSNNQEEYMSLWKGLELEQEINIQRITMFGDSMLVIKQMVRGEMHREFLSHQFFRESTSSQFNLKKMNFFISLGN